MPVADKKAFLDLLENTLDYKTEKDKDDVYTVMLPLPFPTYFRFANDYAYITLRDKENLDKINFCPWRCCRKDRSAFFLSW